MVGDICTTKDGRDKDKENGEEKWGVNGTEGVKEEHKSSGYIQIVKGKKRGKEVAQG